MPRTVLPTGIKRLPATARHSSRIEVPSESTVGKSYVIAITPDGLPVCSCPAFVFRRNRSAGCKHLLAYQHLLHLTARETPRPKNHRSKGRKSAPVSTISSSCWTAAQMDAAIAAFADVPAPVALSS